jgi:regulator of vacuolar morphogenesis
MSLKRQNTSSAEPEEDDRPAKRARPSWVDDFDTFEHPTAREQPRVDTLSGQQSAFPGLDDDNEELMYGEPEDGLQYLRMVR